MNVDFPNTTEGGLQAFCFKWFVTNFPHLRELLQSIPNESKRSPSYANKLKAMGLSPGFPDMAFHFRKTSAFLEFKTDSGKLSPEQERAIKSLKKQGFDVYIIRDFIAFQKALENTFGSGIWRDLMRVNPEHRTVFGNALPDDWSTGELIDASGLDVDVWKGLESEADIIKLNKGAAAVMASRLVLDSTGSKADIVERILIAFRAKNEEKTNNEDADTTEPPADAVDAGTDQVQGESLDLVDNEGERGDNTD